MELLRENEPIADLDLSEVHAKLCRVEVPRDACEVLQSAADDLGFGDDFDQVAAAVAAKLAEIEARAPQG